MGGPNGSVIKPFAVALAFNPSTILQTTNSTLTITFTNPNPAFPLAFDTFSVALPPGLVFPAASSSVPPTTCQLQVATESIDGSSLTVSGSPLAGGASCTLSFAVNGPTLGTFTTSFSITSALAGASNTATATLTVNTNGPVATISPASLTFASQFVGSSSAPQTVTLKNTGNASLSISNVSASGDFAQTNTCGASVAANASCTFTITFTPSASGTRSGSLTLTDNASGSPQAVSLTGSGADFVLGPASASTLTATIQRGQTATYNLSLAPTTGLTGTVSFSCTGAPSESTCTVSPATLATNGTAPSPFAVNVTSTAPTAPPAMLVWQKPGGPFPGPMALIALGLTVASLILLLAKLSEMQDAGRILGARFSRRALALLSSAVLLFAIGASAVSLGGCSGAAIGAPPDLGTPVGTYNVVVTATFTSGASTLKHSLTLTLNVQ